MIIQRLRLLTRSPPGLRSYLDLKITLGKHVGSPMVPLCTRVINRIPVPNTTSSSQKPSLLYIRPSDISSETSDLVRQLYTPYNYESSVTDE